MFGNAQSISTIVAALTDGKFQTSAAGAGELVPPLAVLDAVQNKTVECGHTAGFYYFGKEPALVFDTGVPFGMGPRQHSAWMTHGGGLELMRELYARFDVLQIPCGNTGAQMGGWFRKEIAKPEDFKGLRIRAAGFLGHVYAKLGATPQQIPASDIYPSLEKGTIDAVEWVGPYDDEKLGLHKVAKHYSALKRLIAGGAKLGYWSRPIMQAMQRASQEAMKEQAAADPAFAKVHASWQAFLNDQVLWASVNDGAAEQFLMASQRKAG